MFRLKRYAGHSYVQHYLSVCLLDPEFGSYFVRCSDVTAEACEEDALGCLSHAGYWGVYMEWKVEVLDDS